MEATILLKSVAVLSLFYLVYLMAFRKETHFVVRRHFFLIGIISALCLPFVVFETVTYVKLPAIAGVVSNAQQQEFSPTSFTPLETTQTIDWSYWLWVTYGLGLAFFIGQLLLQLVGLLRLISRHPKTRRGPYTFVEVDENCAPFSFFKYIVYNPKLHGHNELEMILRHEKVHASQWHTFDLMLANILRMLQWFNPFSWLYKKSMEENLEFIADRETAQQLPSLKQYQLALVKASSTYTAPALTTQFYQSFIKKRIIMLNKQSSNKRNILKLGIIVPILCLFLWSFNVKEDIHYLAPEPADTELTDPVEEELALNLPERVAIRETNPAMAKTIEEEKMVQEEFIFLKKVKIKFHKNMTEAELKAVKKQFKDELGLDLSYTTVRNDADEITSIQLSYSGNGRNGNYSISESDGIDEFYFFQDEEGDIGFWSESHEKYRKERMVMREKERQMRNEEHKMRRVERQKEMEERRAEVEVYRMEAMKDREARMAQRVYEVDDLHGRVAVVRSNGGEVEVLSIDDIGELRDEEDNIFVTAEGNGGNLFTYRTHDDHDGDDIFVIRDSDHMSKQVVIITKNSSDADLLKMKADLMEQGVKFKYSKLKRNAQGEITRIKITVDDNKGSSSTVSAEGKDGGPIKKLVAAY